jgi:hypothetical protein
MEPESLLSCSQNPISSPYPLPHESTPHIPKLFPEDPFQYYPPIYAWVLQVVSCLQV